MTPEEAVRDHKHALEAEALAWKKWQLAESNLKQKEAELVLKLRQSEEKYTVQEKEALVDADPKIKTYKDTAINCHWQYLDAKADAQTCYEIFLITHQESKLPGIIEPNY